MSLDDLGQISFSLMPKMDYLTHFLSTNVYNVLMIQKLQDSMYFTTSSLSTPLTCTSRQCEKEQIGACVLKNNCSIPGASMLPMFCTRPKRKETWYFCVFWICEIPEHCWFTPNFLPWVKKMAVHHFFFSISMVRSHLWIYEKSTSMFEFIYNICKLMRQL